MKIVNDPNGATSFFRSYLNEVESHQAILIQSPSKNELFVLDPVLIEKLQQFVPSKIDRNLSFEALGINGFGFKSLVDMQTNEISMQI